MKIEIEGEQCEINVVNFLACPLLVSPTTFRLTENEMNVVINSRFKKVEASGDDKAILGSGVMTSQNTRLLKEPGLERLRSFMVTFTENFVRDCLQITDEFYLTNSWATKNVKNSAHHIHNHDNTLLSAIYYAEAESGDLVLSSNRSGMFPNFDFTWNLSKFNNFNSKTWNIPVRTGNIVIFPGWLNHYSTPNLHDKPRILIGANFFARGIFGSSDTLDLINIGDTNGT